MSKKKVGLECDSNVHNFCNPEAIRVKLKIITIWVTTTVHQTDLIIIGRTRLRKTVHTYFNDMVEKKKQYCT